MSRADRQWKALLDKRIARLYERASVIRTRMRTGVSLPHDPDDLDLLLNIINNYEAAEVLERNMEHEAAARLTAREPTR